MTSRGVIGWSVGAIACAFFGALVAEMIVGGRYYDRNLAAQADLIGLTIQLDVYKERNGSYPTTRQGLHAFVARPDSSPVPHDWIQQFDDDLRDPWHHPYMYRYPSARNPSTCDLFSRGADGVESADDIWLPQNAPNQSLQPTAGRPNR